MRALKLTLFILFLTVISTQTFRHFYVKFIDVKVSVLDKYKNEFSKKIENINDINKLEIMYKEVFDKIENLKNTDKKYYDKDEYKELTNQEYDLSTKIQNLEDVLKKRYELLFYWIFGLISVCLGILVYFLFNKWIGIGSIITGFSEMIIWTSPLYKISVYGFNTLLDIKLLLSIITWFILIILWIINDKFEKVNK